MFDIAKANSQQIGARNPSCASFLGRHGRVQESGCSSAAPFIIAPPGDEDIRALAPFILFIWALFVNSQHYDGRLFPAALPGYSLGVFLV